MKDENIKEKLDGLFETLENDLLSRSQYKLLLDYITNLQEENRKLKKEKDTLLNSLFITRNKYKNDKARYRRKAKIYRARNTKAIEYIKEHACYDKECNMCCDDLWTSGCDEVIEILQGKSDE